MPFALHLPQYPPHRRTLNDHHAHPSLSLCVLSLTSTTIKPTTITAHQTHHQPLPLSLCSIKSTAIIATTKFWLNNGFMISPLMPGFAPNSGFSPRKQEILSPSILDFPSLVLSPVTPLIEDPFDKSSSPSMGNSSKEEKAIAEKKFYFHPSPRRTTGVTEPRLLPLFSVTSLRVSGSSS